MAETISAPISHPSAPVWAKVAKNRRDLSAISNPNSVEKIFRVRDLLGKHFAIYKNNSAYVRLVTPLTINYEVESMTRGELVSYVDSFLQDLGNRPPLDQLVTIEANPGLMLGAIKS
ncbi:hypothetical protein Plhal304r1_c003g0010441 [Plasmopara halstedii]